MRSRRLIGRSRQWPLRKAKLMTFRGKKFFLAALALAAVWAVWLTFRPHGVVESKRDEKISLSSPRSIVGASSQPTVARGGTPTVNVPSSSRNVLSRSGPTPATASVNGYAEALAVKSPASQPIRDEATGTALMYAAHAPLRTREVADPDSKSNRQILQTMMRKAVARSTSFKTQATEP